MSVCVRLSASEWLIIQRKKGHFWTQFLSLSQFQLVLSNNESIHFCLKTLDMSCDLDLNDFDHKLLWKCIWKLQCDAILFGALRKNKSLDKFTYTTHSACLSIFWGCCCCSSLQRPTTNQKSNEMYISLSAELQQPSWIYWETETLKSVWTGNTPTAVQTTM